MQSLLLALCLSVVPSLSGAEHCQSNGQGDCLPQADDFAQDDRAELSLLQTQFYVNPGQESNNDYSRPYDGKTSGNTNYYTRQYEGSPADNANYGFSQAEAEMPYNANVQWSNGAPFVPPGMNVVKLQPTYMPPKPQMLVDSTSSTRGGLMSVVIPIIVVAIVLGIVFVVGAMMISPNDGAEQKNFSLQGMTDMVSRVSAVSPNVLYSADDPDAADGSSTVVKDVVDCPPVELDADTFGMSVCSLIRDGYFLDQEGPTVARVIRIISSISLVVITISMQVFLLEKVKEFVVDKGVHDVREIYDKYELALCGKEHTFLTVNGKHRCMDGFRPALPEAIKALNTLEDEDKDAVCSIPLSQPHFFGVILLIWTLTCLGELRKAFSLQLQLMMLETVPSMSRAMRAGDDEDSDADSVIHGLTLSMKALLTVLMFIPRVLITLYLLYIGCRLLLSTTEFDDLVMNAIALEFIMLIKEVIYVALTPARSHFDLTLTLMEPYPKKMTSSVWSFTNTLLLFAMANFWVWFYMHHFQSVLPQYLWDVHDVCVSYIADAYAA